MDKYTAVYSHNGILYNSYTTAWNNMDEYKRDNINQNKSDIRYCIVYNIIYIKFRNRKN